jgi:hypothetical protein
MLQTLNEMSIAKLTDSQKQIERVIRTLKPAIQIQHSMSKLIQLQIQMIEPAILTG